MMTTPNIDTRLDATGQRESVCLTVAAILHALALLWNPVILRSDFHPAHDFVTVDVVEQPAPGGSPAAPEAPKKMGLMDTLKDMLIKPKAEEIAHIAPEPLTTRVAAPLQPALKDRPLARAINSFQPKSTADDIAMANAPNQIQTQARNMPVLPNSPSLKTKAFGGIQAKDLPFQVGTDEALTGGGAVVPIAVGHNSAKAALSYGGASLQDSKNKPILQGRSGYITSGDAAMNSLGAGAASNIQISGTGGTGNAPTGAPHGSVLQDRAGSGGGGLVNRGFGYGSGGGSGGGIGTGIGGMPSAAAQLDQQLDTSNSAGKGNKKVTNKGFELAGPLMNRPIVKKVIPQYPAWAEEQGIIGSVRLYFTVTPEGAVRTNIRVTKTTGYPQLDELAIEALKQWQFAPTGSTDEGKGEWGIITFNFALSS